jgi:peptide/nickel transport system permease protein
MSTASALADVARGDATPASRRPHFLRRLLRRPVAAVACGYLLVVVAVAIVAPAIWPAASGEFAGDLTAIDQGPSSAHLLGTDALGRDVLERLLVGTQVTLLGVAEALVVVLVLGVPLGLAAGYLGGWLDRIVTWLADLALSVPDIVIVIVVLSVFPTSMFAGMTTLGVLAAPGLMRVVRSVTLPVREQLYVEAAELSGLSRGYIISRHVLPRIAGPVIVQASLLAAIALVAQTGLSFLHLLNAPPQSSWGGMVADGTSVLLVDPWLIWPSGLAIGLTILALCLLGDAIRDTSVERWSAAPRLTRARHRGAAGGAAPVAHDSLLVVEDLTIGFGERDSTLRVVDGVSFEIAPGETVGLVGESGCGKTLTASALLGLLPGTGRIEQGRIYFAGKDLAALGGRELARLRGREIALVSQEPMDSLDPTFTIGAQLRESLRVHLGLSRAAAHAHALDLLASVRLPDPEAVARSYPHQLSGGMAQRVAIGRALAGEPRLLIADEPTTALDVTVQAEILALLRDLTARRNTAVLLITHDWGVVADACDRVVVMYAGQVVERADVIEIFSTPLHPYTRALLASDPHHAITGGELPTIPGSVPVPAHLPRGCRFHPRCALVMDRCAEHDIPLLDAPHGRQVRCLLQSGTTRS